MTRTEEVKARDGQGKTFYRGSELSRPGRTVPSAMLCSLLASSTPSVMAASPHSARGRAWPPARTCESRHEAPQGPGELRQPVGCSSWLPAPPLHTPGLRLVASGAGQAGAENRGSGSCLVPLSSISVSAPLRQLSNDTPPVEDIVKEGLEGGGCGPYSPNAGFPGAKVLLHSGEARHPCLFWLPLAISFSWVPVVDSK